MVRITGSIKAEYASGEQLELEDTITQSHNHLTMQRTIPTIQKDMLEWAKHNLYLRSSDEWTYQTLEADPLVHLLIGACASEAKEVYESVQESDDRLLQRLLQYLLPETFHLPLPAVAIAKAHAKTSRCNLSEMQHLMYREGAQPYCFTPLFDTTLINGKIRFICTDNKVIDFDNSSASERQFLIKNETEMVSRLLIGIETPQPIKSLENVSFYVDWKSTSSNDLEKRQFLLALSKSQWSWNEQVLKRQNGFIDAKNVGWQDHFDPEKRLQQRLNAQYQQQFHVITDPQPPPSVEVLPADILRAWLNKNPFSTEESKSTTTKWTSVTGNFIWLRIQLPYGVKLTDIERHLTFALNHFIVVNRKLVEKDDKNTYFSRSLGMEALSIQPEKGFFQSIKSVVNQATNKEILSLPLYKLIRDPKQTAYSFRLGGVGRSDSYNTWQRLSYMLSIFRQEHRQRDVAERLGDKMSLDELHEIIGEKVSKNDAKLADKLEKQQTPIYFFIQPGESGHQLRIKINYWLTDGEAANNLRPESQLLSEPLVAGLDPLSIRLVSGTRGGKNNYTATEQVLALQDTLLRRGRIVSAHDVKSLCHEKLGEVLKNVTLRSYFETDMNAEGGGVRRAIEVSLAVNDATDPYIRQIGQEIELALQENSVGTMPYRVTIVQG